MTNEIDSQLVKSPTSPALEVRELVKTFGGRRVVNGVSFELQQGEIFGLPIALLILVLVFGAIVAALLPFTLAIISIVIAFGITALIGTQLFELNVFVQNIITMIGLARARPGGCDCLLNFEPSGPLLTISGGDEERIVDTDRQPDHRYQVLGE